MKDQFTEVEAVTPSDANLINRGDNTGGAMLYIGTAGDVKVKTISGNEIVFKNHPVGYMPGRVVQVLSTGTTAADIIALW
jgi:hypothetical protein